jgi:hypothetical protein
MDWKDKESGDFFNYAGNHNKALNCVRMGKKWSQEDTVSDEF